MLRMLAALLAQCVVASVATAACPPPALSDPTTLDVTHEQVLIVTHASSVFDPRFTTKYGVDSAVRYAKHQGIPIVYLIDDSPLHTYMMEDCSPSHWVQSADGDIVFQIKARHVLFAGGHMELCLSRSVHDLLLQAARRNDQDLKVTFLMDAIYSNGKTIQESDPFYEDVSKFFGVVTYGRPGGERWPKLNLLEATGVIKKPDYDYDYLTGLLPRWDRTFGPATRIEIQLNDLPLRVLRKGEGPLGRVVHFHFIDSADVMP